MNWGVTEMCGVCQIGGVVALSRDNIFLSLKIELHEKNELRVKVGLSPT